MDEIRRKLLNRAAGSASLAAALGVGLLRPGELLAAGWNKNAFGAKTPADALKGIGPAKPAESKDVLIEAPQIAENGGVVPIEITSNVPDTRSISVC